jgi:hypothetical protein
VGAYRRDEERDSNEEDTRSNLNGGSEPRGSDKSNDGVDDLGNSEDLEDGEREVNDLVSTSRGLSPVGEVLKPLANQQEEDVCPAIAQGICQLGG